MRTTVVCSELATHGYLVRIHVGRLVAVGAAALAISCTAGCGKEGPDRYDLKGTVTFRGKPVPKGYLIIAPDGEKGNSGPGAKAGILDGNYETMPGQGMVGGPHVVTIFGSDGIPYDQGGGIMNPMGRPMFPQYEAKVDLPKQSGTHDFEVPGDK